MSEAYMYVKKWRVDQIVGADDNFFDITDQDTGDIIACFDIDCSELSFIEEDDNYTTWLSLAEIREILEICEMIKEKEAEEARKK